jgi:uncharacterized Fe-S radical SAM superfamily protein PflX
VTPGITIFCQKNKNKAVGQSKQKKEYYDVDQYNVLQIFSKKCSPKAKNISQVGGDDVAAVHPVISPSATQA